jgi:hypothetical protein
MKTRIAKGLLAITLSACGGSSDTTVQAYNYRGAVSGVNCFGGFPQSAQISYAITIDALAAGSSVTLLDEMGTTWAGTMTTPSSFKVTNTTPNADPRTSIVVSGITPSEAHVDATTSCVSFRCCTTLSGNVSS